MAPETLRHRLTKLFLRWFLLQSRGVTEPVPIPDATGACPAIGPRDALPHAGQVVRRVLLRRNIVIDAETARLGA